MNEDRATNDAEERFAARLSEDLERTLAIGVVIEDLVISDEPPRASVTVTLLLNGRTEMLDAWAPDADTLERLILQRAADLWRTHAFEGLAGPLV